MGTLIEMPTPEAAVKENTAMEALGEAAQTVAECAGSMAERFARKPAVTVMPVTGEQIGRKFAETYAAALAAFKESSPAASEAEQGHAARELASIAADAARRNLGITGENAEPLEHGR